MLETGAPLGELSECLNEGRSEGQPLRWAPFAGNEELRLRDSPAGCYGECLRAGGSTCCGWTTSCALFRLICYCFREAP